MLSCQWKTRVIIPELYNKSVKTGPHVASSGPSGLHPRGHWRPPLGSEASDRAGGRARGRGARTHAGIDPAPSGMGAGGRRPRTDFLLHAPPRAPQPIAEPIRPRHPNPIGAEVQARGACGVRSWAAALCCLLPRSMDPFPLPRLWQQARNACRAGWEQGREASVCRSLPRFRHEGCKSIWGPRKVSVLFSDCVSPLAPSFSSSPFRLSAGLLTPAPG